MEHTDTNAQYPYQLQLQSLAVDSGNNNASDIPAEDLMGRPRIQNAKGLATAIIDMGAHEYPGMPAPPPPKDFALTLNPSTLQIVIGQQGTVTVTLTPTSTFQGIVTLSCGALPATVSCTFQPQQIQLANGVPATAQLQIGTSATAQVNAANGTNGEHRILVAAAMLPLPGCIAGILLLLPSRKLNRRMRSLLMLVLIAYMVGGLSACGVTFNGFPGNYTITVYGTANSGGLTHQANLALTALH